MDAKAKWTGDRLDERFSHIDHRFDSLEQRFDRVEKRLDWLIGMVVAIMAALVLAALRGGLGGQMVDSRSSTPG